MVEEQMTRLERRRREREAIRRENRRAMVRIAIATAILYITVIFCILN